MKQRLLCGHDSELYVCAARQKGDVYRPPPVEQRPQPLGAWLIRLIYSTHIPFSFFALHLSFIKKNKKQRHLNRPCAWTSSACVNYTATTEMFPLAGCYPDEKMHKFNKTSFGQGFGAAIGAVIGLFGLIAGFLKLQGLAQSSSSSSRSSPIKQHLLGGKELGVYVMLFELNFMLHETRGHCWY